MNAYKQHHKKLALHQLHEKIEIAKAAEEIEERDTKRSLMLLLLMMKLGLKMRGAQNSIKQTMFLITYKHK
jgi:hypothetical protein